MYSLALTRKEVRAIRFLASRYKSARLLFDSLDPNEESDDMALSLDFDCGEGPYGFDVWHEDALAIADATESDGGRRGVIPNLDSPQIEAMLADVSEPS